MPNDPLLQESGSMPPPKQVMALINARNKVRSVRRQWPDASDVDKALYAAELCLELAWGHISAAGDTEEEAE